MPEQTSRPQQQRAGAEGGAASVGAPVPLVHRRHLPLGAPPFVAGAPGQAPPPWTGAPGSVPASGGRTITSWETVQDLLGSGWRATG
jgi:hypothetical protein